MAMEKLNDFDPAGKKILIISAHPDDADFAAGGTVLKWLKKGAKGAIVIATNGNKGSHNHDHSHDQLSEIRKQEQLAASEFLGLEKTWFLDYPDAHLEVSQELKEKLVRIIREYKPDILFTWDPTFYYSLERNMVNHPDHRAIGEAALDAAFPMARDFLTFPDHQKENLLPHCVCDIFLFNFDNANFFVDISNYISQKLELLCKHESQIEKTRIKKILEELAARNGKKVGVKSAEAFVHISLNKD